MNNVLQTGLRILVAFLQVLRSLLDLGSLLPRFCRDVCRALRLFGQRPQRDCCLHVPMVYKRADPLLYSQPYLLSQGLAVTWDNPDIDLFQGGVLVNPWQLRPDQEYQVRVRCWNGSYDAPALGLPVHLAYLSFGIGTTTTYIGTQVVDLGVKASSQCPVFADFRWRTPATPGHYCLQVDLDWPDDANPANNVGQKNTQVGTMQSPARFQLAVHNDASVRRVIQLEADMYTLPQLPPCPEPEDPGAGPATARTGAGAPGRLAESSQRWAAVRAEQSYGMFPVAPGWRVLIEPPELVLEARQSATVRVLIETDDPTFAGRRAFNIHGFAPAPNGARTPVGGVTLLVERT